MPFRRKQVLTLICVVLLLRAEMGAGEMQSLSTEGPRLLLVWLLGGDLESSSSSVMADLAEMIHGTKELPLDIYIRASGSSVWFFPGLLDGHSYDLHIAGGIIEIIEDYGDRSCANAEDFTSFLKAYGKSGCDLILWGHGCGGTRGIGYDILHDKDTLAWTEIQEGLEDSGIFFRMIGMDACKMASLELTWMIAPYAEVFAASPEDEKVTGWDYRQVLPALMLDTASMVEILRKVCRARGKEEITVVITAQVSISSEDISKLMNMASIRYARLDILVERCPEAQVGTVIDLLNGQKMLFQLLTQEDMWVIERMRIPDNLRESYLSYALRNP